MMATEYIRHTKEILHQLKAYNEIIDDQVVVEQVLNGLLEAWDNFVRNILSGVKELPDLAELQALMQLEEDRFKRREDS
ncbi:hypothetical protein R1flu_004952 [Riccia fluitans]|uniref:Uncharacterized protein n=1 Tax=Riccia fluitans TaxID=41844 RepID=A0ABD1YSD5_9MARC